MAKSTRIELGPDDPIFSQGPQIFVPVSRPSTAGSTKNTDGEAPLEQRRNSQQEQEKADSAADDEQAPDG